MSQKTVTTCDCGCGVTDEGKIVPWFTLARNNFQTKIEVRGPLHFADFKCLNKWVSKAAITVKEMEQYLQSDIYEGEYFDGSSFADKDDSMRKLVRPVH